MSGLEWFLVRACLYESPVIFLPPILPSLLLLSSQAWIRGAFCEAELCRVSITPLFVIVFRIIVYRLFRD